MTENLILYFFIPCMEIAIKQLIKGASEAKGLTVIIDVFRAFSLACYVMERGADTIIPVGKIEYAYELKKNHPEYILMGERNERIPEGFDYGNSPTHIEHLDFTGKTVVHTTSAGTQGIVHAVHADEIITGSLVNAQAISKYIKLKNPEIVSLVCMGYSAMEPADEDTFCAEYIYSLLKGNDYDINGKTEILRKGSGRRLLDPANASFSPARDFELCTAVNSFPFILKAVNHHYYYKLERVYVY